MLLNETYRKIKILTPLYFPWILAESIAYYAELSYFIAWMGSFYIFYLTIFSPFRFQSIDLPMRHQVMRPLVMIQVIFAGFMCCTSIFYFLNHLNHFQPDVQGQITLIAKCQRISLLAHAAMVSGIIIATKSRPVIPHKILTNPFLLVILSTVAYSLTLIIDFVPLPALTQIKYPLLNISISCAACILVKGIANKNPSNLFFGGFAFFAQLLNSTLSGYKETIIVYVILICFIAFPYFKKTVTLLSLPIVYLLFYTLPTFTTVIRAQSWTSGKPLKTARENAYETFFNEEDQQQIMMNNEEFLINRLSEIGMFTKYVKLVPEQQPYYGLQIISNSFYSLIPRIVWTDKPNTEKIAMERVYECGVVSRASSVSAKTRPIVDGYLSAGFIGVFVYMFIYGLLAQFLCNKAEQLFGGYQVGCIIIFNSIFQPLWRGNTFEFLLNNILYGYLLMYLIYLFMKKFKIVNP
ncbi:exosortase Y-associated Wzy-like protein [Pedobacter frigoris]|uniref:Oligosaccharide repeat unit polymerase n=1 Tax=Pedobacter frigoris TaxID=2571272 RepID=A0A4V6WN60_9SPHI|nr:hypothetical protein [Pedobacter frigoris]TKC08642.1 hypothetical protein FA047_00645 [Pedobacter frigoris]